MKLFRMNKKRFVVLLTVGLASVIIFLWATNPFRIGIYEIVTAVKAIILPQKQGTISYKGIEYNVILPHRSALLKETGKYQVYLSITSLNSRKSFKLLHKYYYEELPASGWRFQDQLGSGYVFTDGTVRLISTRHGLIRGVEKVTFSIRE